MMDLGYWSFMMEQERDAKASRGNRVYNAENDFRMCCVTASPGDDVTDLFHLALRRNGVQEFELTAADRDRFQAIADKYMR